MDPLPLDIERYYAQGEEQQRLSTGQGGERAAREGRRRATIAFCSPL